MTDTTINLRESYQNYLNAMREMGLPIPPTSYETFLENVCATYARETEINERVATALLELYQASRPIERSIGSATEDMHHAFFVATGNAYGALKAYGYSSAEITKERPRD